MITWNKYFIRIVLLFSLFCVPESFLGQIVLTEVMFNPVGDESRQEWIEVCNIGDTAISVFQWQVEMGSKRQDLQPPPGTSDTEASSSIPAGSYALIRDTPYWLTDPPGEASEVPDTVPRFAASLTLSNSTGTPVRLLNPAGDTVTEYTYTVDNQEGYSDEKILPAGPNTPANWTNSTSRFGTPGRRNSVTPFDQDLRLTPHPTWIPDPAVPDSTLRLSLIIVNSGLQPSPKAEVIVSRDEDSASAPALSPVLGTAPVPPLLPADSARVELTITLPSGRHRLSALLRCEVDQDTSDNNLTWTLPVRYPSGSVVINEIMYDPVAGEPEWMEVYHPGPDPIDLTGWTLGDASSRVAISGDLALPKDNYVVFLRSNISDNYNNISYNAYYLDAFPTLNNTGDQLSLRDASGSLIDTVVYLASQGGGDGVSLERINPLLSGMAESNWAGSVHPTGATPGVSNSIAAPAFDLALVQVVTSPAVGTGHPLRVTALITNSGMHSIANYTAQIYDDRNENGIPEPAELLRTVEGETCSPGDSVLFEFSPGILAGGRHRILATVQSEQDEFLSNNQQETPVYVGYPAGSILLSEVMYRPESGEPEWMELYIAADSVDLRGFRIRDQGHTGFLRQSKRHLYRKGQYVVLSGDSSVMQSYDMMTFALELVEGFPTLNNGADSVQVLGADGLLVDGFRYMDTWGGGLGISLERRSLLASARYPENWKSSSAPAGATPGGENSIAIHDPFLLTIHRIDSIFSVPPSQEFPARYVFLNHGMDTLAQPEFRIGFDADEDHRLGPAETQKHLRLRRLFPGDSLQVTVRVTAPERAGNHQLLLVAEESGEQLDVQSLLWVPYPRQSVLFNEILPDPSERYPSEFVEVVNITGQPLILDQLELQVNDRVAVTDSPVVFPPRAYVILGEEDFFDPAMDAILLPRWNNLPNTGGTLRLRDQYGNVIDSLTYDQTWPLEPGRSLERLHLRPGDHSPANWRTCLDQEGATPGHSNSLYLPADSLAAGWAIGPSPFSPDADGSDDFLQIRYTGRSPLHYVTIHIYDTAGRLIRSLAQDEGAGTSSIWVWDGQDLDGNPAPIGLYLLYIEYTTLEGNSREKLERVILAKPL